MKTKLLLASFALATVIVFTLPSSVLAASAHWITQTQDMVPQYPVFQLANGTYLTDFNNFNPDSAPIGQWICPQTPSTDLSWINDGLYKYSNWSYGANGDFPNPCPNVLSNPPAYTTAATFDATDNHSGSYNPGDLVSITASANSGDQSYGPNTRGLNAVTCFFFGCSGHTAPWVRINAYFPNWDALIGECTDTGGCATSASFSAPATPGTYTVGFIGCDQGGQCPRGSFDITVAGPGSCATTHYGCTSSAPSTNNVDGATAYTWLCPGSGGGATVSCTEPKAAPPPATTPSSGCTDPTATNSGSYTISNNSLCTYPPPGTATVMVYIAPSLDLYIDPIASPRQTTATVPSGGAKTISWSSTNTTSCTATGPFGTVPNLPTSYSSWNTGSLTTSTTYSMTCTGSGGTTPSSSVTVNVTPATCSNGLNMTTYPTCFCPSGQRQSGSVCIPQTCANGLNYSTYGPLCTCPSAQTQSGSVCITPTCSNGLNYSTYGPSCTCPAGQRQSGSSCVANTPSGLVTSASCTIPLNGTSCSLSPQWSSSNTTGVVTLQRTYTVPHSIIATGINSTAAGNPFFLFSPPGAYILGLYDGSTQLTTGTFTSSCVSGSVWNGSSCVSNTCANGANNPLTGCTQCPDGRYYNTSTSQCTACGSVQGCGGAGGTVSNPIPNTLYCINGAIPVACSTCTAPKTMVGGVCTAPPAPTVSLFVNGSNSVTIDNGQSIKLSWSSSGATTCYPAGGEGVGFSTGGATSKNNPPGVSISPSTTSNYQISCTGAGGTTNSNIVTVTVTVPAVSISANPMRVSSGNTSTITWSAVGVTSCHVTGPSLASRPYIANGSEAVVNNRSPYITPSLTDLNTPQTYTIDCNTNGGANIVDSVTVDLQGIFRTF